MLPVNFGRDRMLTMKKCVEDAEQLASFLFYERDVMNIKRIRLDDIKPASYNPRKQLKPGEKEYEALKASISRWSLVEPLVVNLRTGNLVGGHQRYNVLRDLLH